MRIPLVLAWALSVVFLAPAPLPAADAPRSVNALVIPSGQVRDAIEKPTLDWIRAQGHPLPAGDPTPEDLAQLVAELGTPRVIGIGEITHGTHEDLALKSALIMALLQQGDIDWLVFEVNRRTGERLQQFVAPGSTETDAGAAMEQADLYGVWRTHEVANLLDAVRRWNASASHPVRIIGVDVQDTSHDLAYALNRLKGIDPALEQRLRPRLSDWLGDTAMDQHQMVTIKEIDRARWSEAMQAGIELEASLAGKDPAGHRAAQAARNGLSMLEYHAKGAKPGEFPLLEFNSRRDIAMANQLVANLQAGQRAVLWAHDMHVLRMDRPYGFGFTTMGAQLHHLLGRQDYRTVTFSARRIDFNAKDSTVGVGADDTPYLVWRYDSAPEDFGTFLSQAGMPRYWINLGSLPNGPTLGFHGLQYGRPFFGWGVGKQNMIQQMPVGFGSDFIVHFDEMTPSHRLETAR